jgi:hypothetical protein
MTIKRAITIDSITDNGTAISTGKKRRNNGTATSDSPKPSVDLTSEAKKLMMRTRISVDVMWFCKFQSLEWGSKIHLNFFFPRQTNKYPKLLFSFNLPKLLPENQLFHFNVNCNSLSNLNFQKQKSLCLHSIL